MCICVLVHSWPIFQCDFRRKRQIRPTWERLNHWKWADQIVNKSPTLIYVNQYIMRTCSGKRMCAREKSWEKHKSVNYVRKPIKENFAAWPPHPQTEIAKIRRRIIKCISFYLPIVSFLLPLFLLSIHILFWWRNSKNCFMRKCV